MNQLKQNKNEKSGPYTVADEVNRLHGELMGLARTNVEKAIRIGELLANQKAKIQHGQWLMWIKVNLAFSEATVRRYTRCYDRREQLKSVTLTDLTDAYRLLAAPNGEPEPEAKLDLEAEAVSSDPPPIDPETDADLNPPATAQTPVEAISPQAPAPKEDTWTPSELERKAKAESGLSVLANYRCDDALIAWAVKTGRLVRIDRNSSWGNPFEMDTPKREADGDRETVNRNYSDFYLPHKPSLLKKLPTLAGGKVLACWCHPEHCHGDVLLDTLAEQEAEPASFALDLGTSEPSFDYESEVLSVFYDPHLSACTQFRDRSNLVALVMGRCKKSANSPGCSKMPRQIRAAIEKLLARGKLRVFERRHGQAGALLTLSEKEEAKS